MGEFRGRTRWTALSRAVAVIALVTTLFNTGVPAQAAPVDNPYAAQAEAAGLTPAQTSALQARVSDYLNEMGGRQVALNEIAFDGGQLLVALPGEDQPRNFGSGSGTQVVESPCAVEMYNGWFCAFRYTGFQGDQLNWYYCGTYNMPWTGFGSWRNNQTRGTRARFLNASGAVIYTTPPAYSSSLSYNWGPVYRVRPC